MNQYEIAQKVQAILAVLLDRDMIEGEQVILSQEPAWHSIKLLELVLLLEEAFTLKLLPIEIASFERSIDLVKFIESKLLF